MPTQPPEARSLKNGLGRPAIKRLGANIERAWSSFETAQFVTASMRGLAALELKQRVGHVATALARYLPDDYPEAVGVVERASETWDRGAEGDPLGGFAAWPLFHFIEHFGTDYFAESMAALRSITHLFSAEFAVRPYITRYPKRAFAELARWSRDDSEQVRRLVSECTRSRLPWATRIPPLDGDPAPVLSLLERLKDDPALYVRRSVANNLNDIAREHPETVLDVCDRWIEGASAERRWIVERATRSLVKSGHPRVWKLLGFTARPRVEVSNVTLNPRSVRMGEEITFVAEITSTARSTQRLAVDYVVHFVKANGETRPKVFKLRVLDLKRGETAKLSRRHSFRAISTRKYYPGRHAIEIVVNGAALARAEFELSS